MIYLRKYWYFIYSKTQLQLHLIVIKKTSFVAINLRLPDKIILSELLWNVRDSTIFRLNEWNKNVETKEINESMHYCDDDFKLKIVERQRITYELNTGSF